MNVSTATTISTARSTAVATTIAKDTCTQTSVAGDGAQEQSVQKIEFRAMGSHMMAAIESDDPRAAALLAEVPAWFEQWEQLFSRFRPDSDLSKLNRHAGSPMPVHIGRELTQMLSLALEAARHTGGLVTPTVLDALENAGYTRNFDDMSLSSGEQEGAGQVQREGAASRHTARRPGIKLYRRAGAVSMPVGARLDLGGIAKGWAADEAAGRLAVYGASLVDAGGDIAVAGGSAEDAGWPIGIAAPLAPGFDADEDLGVLMVKRGGVATSGRDYRRWRQGDKWQHHIIDPRTGLPAATHVLTATVVAPQSSLAEVAAKAVLLMGSTEGMQWIDAQPSLAALVVLESGQVVQSCRLSTFLWSQDRI